MDSVCGPPAAGQAAVADHHSADFVPDSRCPFCVALAALPWPAEGTEGMRLCVPHLADWRRLQCRGWNADPAHQQMAGFASWDAFSARWRASGGLCPLTPEAVRKYVTPDMIRGISGRALSPELQQDIYRAWCAGVFAHVADWLAGEAPADPDGLWVGGDGASDNAGVIGSSCGGGV
jgi:hypothetical protein